MFLPPLFALVFAIGFAASERGVVAQTEVARIQEHLDGALALMATRDLSGLTPFQRANRARLTETLRAYRNRGAFPKNYDFPGERIPYFVDHRTGVFCAVGHLMAATGRRDVVDRVAAIDNHVRVAALAGDAEFVEWLDQQGLTPAEAARIQPTYGPSPSLPAAGDETNLWRPDQSTTTAWVVGSLSLGALNLILPEHRGFSFASAVGLTTGLAAFGVGASHWERHGVNAVPAAIAGAGMFAVITSLRGFTPTTGTNPRRPRIAPVVPIDRGQGFGVSVSLAF